MSQFGDTVTLVNRTKKTVLSCQWDGTHYHFDPGPTPNVPLAIAIAAYRQNPLHGSEDPLGDPDAFVSLIGLEKRPAPYGDTSPLEQSKAGERMDRSQLAHSGKEATRRNAGAPTRGDARLGTEKVDLSSDAHTRTD